MIKRMLKWTIVAMIAAIGGLATLIVWATHTMDPPTPPWPR
jgi:hypothetical protein